jgi:hypothetical protein
MINEIKVLSTYDEYQNLFNNDDSHKKLTIKNANLLLKDEDEIYKNFNLGLRTVCVLPKNNDLKNRLFEKLYNIDKGKVLIFGAEIGCFDMVKKCIKKGVNLNVNNDRGLTPLMRASCLGHSNIVKILLENNAKADLERNGETILEMALYNNKVEVVELLINNKKNTESKKKELLERLSKAFHFIKRDREVRLKETLRYIKTQVPYVKEINDIILSIIRIYHAVGSKKLNFNPENKISIHDKIVQLDGYNPIGWIKFMIEVTDTVLTSGKEKFSTIKEMLEFSLDIRNHDKQIILDRIKNGTPTFLPIVWYNKTKEVGHAIAAIFVDNRIMLFDRSDDSMIDVCTFDKDKICVEDLNQLLSRSMQSREEFKKIFAKIKLNLNSSEDDLTRLIKKNVFLKAQETDTCSYGNIEGALLGLLKCNQFLHLHKKLSKTKVISINSIPQSAIQKQKTKAAFLFLNWVFNARKISVEKYLHAVERMNLKPNLTFLRKVFSAMTDNCILDIYAYRLGSRSYEEYASIGFPSTEYSELNDIFDTQMLGIKKKLNIK